MASHSIKGEQDYEKKATYFADPAELCQYQNSIVSSHREWPKPVEQPAPPVGFGWVRSTGVLRQAGGEVSQRCKLRVDAFEDGQHLLPPD